MGYHDRVHAGSQREGNNSFGEMKKLQGRGAERKPKQDRQHNRAELPNLFLLREVYKRA